MRHIVLVLGYPKEFWLRVTNSVLGTLLLILVALVIIGLILDTIRRLKRLLKVTPINTSESNKVGVTLPDGGEKRNREENLCPGSTKTFKPWT